MCGSIALLDSALGGVDAIDVASMRNDQRIFRDYLTANMTTAQVRALRPCDPGGRGSCVPRRADGRDRARGLAGPTPAGGAAGVAVGSAYAASDWAILSSGPRAVSSPARAAASA